MEFTPEQMEAIQRTYMAAYEALRAPSIVEAIRDARKCGLTVCCAALQFHFVPTEGQAVTPENAAQIDADFLKGLRIDPDLAVSAAEPHDEEAK